MLYQLGIIYVVDKLSVCESCCIRWITLREWVIGAQGQFREYKPILCTILSVLERCCRDKQLHGICVDLLHQLEWYVKFSNN